MDWKTIQTEYITDESSSYRKLAEKYDVPLTTLADRAKKEEWAKKKKQHRDKVITKSIKKKETEQVNRLTRIQTVADRLLDKIEQSVEELDIQLYKNVEKVKIIEYNNIERPDKPTKETITEKENLTELHTIIDRKGVQELSNAIKNLKEIQMLKTELDIREQEARIRNLEKQAEDDNKPNKITITIEGGEETWQQ